MLIDSPSPTREQKARQAVAEATATATASGAPTKWKMQVGSSMAASTSRFKRKADRDEWLEETDKRGSKNGRDELDDSPKRSVVIPSVDKNVSVRKAMAMKEGGTTKKDSESKKNVKVPAPIAMPKPIIPQGQVVLDKFGNFRLMTPPKDGRGHDELPPLPPGAPPKTAPIPGNHTFW